MVSTSASNLGIWEVPGLNLAISPAFVTEIFSQFSSVSPVKCWDTAIKYDTNISVTHNPLPEEAWFN
jgi:hypothetical protein